MNTTINPGFLGGWLHSTPAPSLLAESSSQVCARMAGARMLRLAVLAHLAAMELFDERPPEQSIKQCLSEVSGYGVAVRQGEDAQHCLAGQSNGR